MGWGGLGLPCLPDYRPTISEYCALAELPEMPKLLLELMDSEDILPSSKWLAEAGLAD